MKRTLIISEALEAIASADGQSPHWAGPAGYPDLETGTRLGASRTDEFLEGAKWVLERDAEAGRQVWQDPPIYFLAMDGGSKQPSLSLFYTIAYDKVVLLSLLKGNEGNAGNRLAEVLGIGPGAAGY
jgi:hypothetical protein